MADPSARAAMTERRRQAILDAALECFSTAGFDQTTISDIRRSAGASTGSIYHHFASKEDVAACLYLQAVEETQQAGVAALLRTRTGRTGVSALVHAYLDWVVQHPAKARFLLGMRHAPLMDAVAPDLAERNDDTSRRAAGWFAGREAAGDLPRTDPSIRRAVIFGPCRHWAGRWLASDTSVPVERAKQMLATAAYEGLMAIGRPSGDTGR